MVDGGSVDEKKRQCLICGVPITECHLGIDSCRACSVFYKRTLPLNQNYLKCKQSDGNCMTTETTSNCRKCRFAKFCAVLARANEEASDNQRSDENSSCATATEQSACSSSSSEATSSSFIDHTSFFNCDPSCSDTPYLDRMKRGYSLMCLIRKSGEIATKPAGFIPNLSDFEGSKLNFTPGTYKAVLDTGKILAGAAYDFGNATFDDFRELAEGNKVAVILHSLPLFAHCDATYRAAHHFPNDDTVFAGYTMTFSNDTAELFLEGSQAGVHMEDILSIAKDGMARGTKLSKGTFLRVAPTQYEFLALLGLSFWSNELSSVSDDFMEMVERNRDTIMKELHIVYKKQGKSDYATRLGDVLCLLDSLETHTTKAMEELELYKLMNVFI